ncbi:hypothetical protein ACJMK2_004357, partial [Sinanodonta woodiana]
YEMYKDSIDKSGIGGVSPIAGVCDVNDKVSLIQSKHYYRTVMTATHELGHNLGAFHDGTADAKECNADERYIMHHRVYKLTGTTPYSRNAWLFSSCSVKSFKETLLSRDCVKAPGSVYDRSEWMMFMKNQPAYVFSLTMQCYLIYGPQHVPFG